MRQATPQLRELAGRVLAREAKRSRGTAAFAGGLEGSCRRLHARLDPLIGAGGFRALLARALYLAAKEFPWLEAVRIEELPSCELKGLREAVKGLDAPSANGAFALVLANVIWLLVTFIGEDIVSGLLREVWPEVETGAVVSASREGEGR